MKCLTNERMLVDWEWHHRAQPLCLPFWAREFMILSGYSSWSGSVGNSGGSHSSLPSSSQSPTAPHVPCSAPWPSCSQHHSDQKRSCRAWRSAQRGFSTLSPWWQALGPQAQHGAPTWHWTPCNVLWCAPPADCCPCGRIDAILVADHLPEVDTNMIGTLPSLQLHDLPRGGGARSKTNWSAEEQTSRVSWVSFYVLMS